MALAYNKLTKAGIKAMPPGSRLTEHGIVAEKTKAGDVIYRVAAMVDGERISRTVGKESEGVTRTQAEDALETFRTRAREGRLDLPKARKNYPNFGEAAATYIERMKVIGAKDIINKSRHLAQRLIPFFSNTRIDQITRLNVDEYVSSRTGHAKQATVNRELSTLSHMFNRLVEWKVIKSDHRPKIVKGAEARKPITVLSSDSSEALMRSSRNDSDERLYLFVAFGLNAAMRHSEIVAVRYDQIDFVNRRVFIPQAKGGAREQPLTSTLVEMLEARRKVEADPDGWVFPAKNGKGGHRPSMEYGFKRAVLRAGLNPSTVTPHVMRHSAITKLVKAGVDIPTIQKISAHKTPAMVMRYVHIHGHHIDAAIETLNTTTQSLVT